MGSNTLWALFSSNGTGPNGAKEVAPDEEGSSIDLFSYNRGKADPDATLALRSFQVCTPNT